MYFGYVGEVEKVRWKRQVVVEYQRGGEWFWVKAGGEGVVQWWWYWRRRVDHLTTGFYLFKHWAGYKIGPRVVDCFWFWIIRDK